MLTRFFLCFQPAAVSVKTPDLDRVLPVQFDTPPPCGWHAGPIATVGSGLRTLRSAGEWVTLQSAARDSSSRTDTSPSKPPAAADSSGEKPPIGEREPEESETEEVNVPLGNDNSARWQTGTSCDYRLCWLCCAVVVFLVRALQNFHSLFRAARLFAVPLFGVTTAALLLLCYKRLRRSRGSPQLILPV